MISIRATIIGALTLLVTVGSFGDVYANAARSVEAVELIAVGRVIGTVDDKPGVAARKRFEVHWVEMERTLKGNDVSGQKFAVRPNGATWRDGETYVLLLDDVWGDTAIAARNGQPLLATPENVLNMERRTLAAGAGVRPRRILWLRHVGTRSTQPIAKLVIVAGGGFEWMNRDAGIQTTSGVEMLSGTMPSAAVDALVRQIAETPSGPADDDSDFVIVGWVDSDGRTRAKAFYPPMSRLDWRPAEQLLRKIEALARNQQ